MKNSIIAGLLCFTSLARATEGHLVNVNAFENGTYLGTSRDCALRVKLNLENLVLTLKTVDHPKTRYACADASTYTFKCSYFECSKILPPDPRSLVFFTTPSSFAHRRSPTVVDTYEKFVGEVKPGILFDATAEETQVSAVSLEDRWDQDVWSQKLADLKTSLTWTLRARSEKEALERCARRFESSRCRILKSEARETRVGSHTYAAGGVSKIFLTMKWGAVVSAE